MILRAFCCIYACICEEIDDQQRLLHGITCTIDPRIFQLLGTSLIMLVKPIYEYHLEFGGFLEFLHTFQLGMDQVASYFISKAAIFPMIIINSLLQSTCCIENTFLFIIQCFMRLDKVYAVAINIISNHLRPSLFQKSIIHVSEIL